MTTRGMNTVGTITAADIADIERGEARMSRKLVAYFSPMGTTAAVAKTLAEAAGADLYEIKAKVPYTKEDLNWMNEGARSTVEMKNPAGRPEIADRSAGVEAYDTVFLGFPIWWYIAPTIINTFLEQYDFSGKTVVLFATSGGSDFGEAVKYLQPSAPGANIVEGRLLNGRPGKKKLEEWVNSLKL